MTRRDGQGIEIVDEGLRLIDDDMAVTPEDQPADLSPFLGI
ncbi:MAG: hypothetical protein AAB112_06625 [Thermodesulfobacteriota bacterium]